MSALAQETPNESIAAGEYSFTKGDFDRIAKIMFDETAIYLSDVKTMLVYSRLAKRLRALDIPTFKDYCDFVDSDAGADERKNLITALTTNVTRFYREPHHFDHLEKTVVPDLQRKLNDGGRARIWSSACSNGQEPYSIAMSLLETLPNVLNTDTKILASDIDTNMIAEARTGLYSSSAIANVAPERKSRYLTECDNRHDEWRVNDKPRELISFRELNLVGKWPMKGKFDVVFCRNVVIYFQEDTQEMLWSRFADVIEPGGWLYVGHSERIIGKAADEFESGGATIYRRK